MKRIRGAAGTARFPAALGDFLVVNTEDADVRIMLPVLDSASAGRCVAYARYDAANALTFEGAFGVLINGAATFTAAAAVGRGLDLVNDGTAWWTA